MTIATVDIRHDILTKLLQDYKDGTNTTGLISPAAASVMLAMHESVKPRDPISGFIQDKKIKSLVQMSMHGRDMEMICIGADISNLRGLNLILSGQNITDKDPKDNHTKEANQVLGMITEIYRQELEKLAPHEGTGNNPNVL